MYAYNSICILTTLQKNARQPKRKSPKTKTPPPSELLRARFSTAQLLGRFHQLLPVSLLAAWLALSDQAFYARAFCTKPRNRPFMDPPCIKLKLSIAYYS